MLIKKDSLNADPDACTGDRVRFVSHPRRARLASAVFLAAALGASRAQAGEPRRVVLRYEGPATCPDAAAFRGQVSARTPVAVFVGSDRAPASGDGAPMRVEISRQAGTFHGTLETNFDHTNRVRRLDDAVCADLVNALALSAALAVDPEATAIAPSPASASVPSDIEAPETKMPPGASPEPKMTPAPHSAAAASASADRPSPPATSATRGVHWDWSAALGFEVDTAIGASPLGGVVLRGPELRLGSSLLLPAFRPSFAGMSSTLFPNASPLAEFTLWRGRAWMSALGVEAGPLLFRPSVGFGLGWLSARGLAVFEPRTSGSLWGELAATVETTASLGRYAFASVHVGALVPLTTTTFVFDGPKRVIHQTDALGALAEIDLGVRFR